MLYDPHVIQRISINLLFLLMPLQILTFSGELKLFFYLSRGRQIFDLILQFRITKKQEELGIKALYQ